jgi:acetyl coenzyme A synthetase (ADP forming)-like protein
MTLDVFFNPKSVAVIGASRNPKKPGHIIFRNLLESGLKHIYPINPKADQLFGIKCYPSVLKVKGKIDMAVISIPAQLTPKVLKECAKKGVKGVIIISGGFKETGNIELEEQLRNISKKHKIRVMGPNCMGIFDPHSKIDTIFNPKYKLGRPEKGSISFISQSGAIMCIIMDWMSRKGYTASKFISYGNAADVDESDLLEYLKKDRKTKVISVYLEGTEDGRKLYKTLKKVTPKKPVAILKAGVTEHGKKSVASHTGSLAGSAEIYSASFKQSGAIEAKDLEQLFDFSRVLATQPAPKGDRVQIITCGGGFGVMTTDWVVKNGLKMAQMENKNFSKLRNTFPPHIVVGNPTDLTGDATTEMYRISIEAALKDRNTDMLIVIALLQPPLLTADVTEVIIEASKKKKKPLIVISAGGQYTEVLKKTMESNGVPCFSFPERAVEALAAFYRYHAGC